ncbi:CPBP family intramembrane metalloprotease [Planctomycetaceae bacterium]|nr:CPBP family intramembrane metalloprotease [Planctomycetaceae bacterium]
MLSTANDTTLCLPVRKPKVDRDSWDFNGTLDELVEFERSAQPVSEKSVFTETLAEAVRFEIAADPLSARETAQLGKNTGAGGDAPRIWTVFVAMVLAIGAIVVGQFALVIVLAIGLAASGVASDDLRGRLLEIVGHPAGFIGLGLVAQLAIGLAAVLPAMFSRSPFRQRLGLLPSSLPSWGFPVVMVGSLAPAALGILAAVLVVEVIPPQDNSLATLMENMTPAWAISFVLFISLAPGLCEELLFRGYLQTRLLERWKPGFAILVSSALFALFHITPHAMALAFIAGLFLGVLAWQTGSIWPGVLCHAFINGSLNVLRLGQKFEVWSESTSSVLAIAMTSLGVVCFGVSVWLMVKPRSERTRQKSLSPRPRLENSVRLVRA